MRVIDVWYRYIDIWYMYMYNIDTIIFTNAYIIIKKYDIRISNDYSYTNKKKINPLSIFNHWYFQRLFIYFWL